MCQVGLRHAAIARPPLRHADDVPRSHFEEVMNAGSPGSYLNDNIKPFYRCVPA